MERYKNQQLQLDLPLFFLADNIFFESVVEPDNKNFSKYHFLSSPNENFSKSKDSPLKNKIARQRVNDAYLNRGSRENPIRTTKRYNE